MFNGYEEEAVPKCLEALQLNPHHLNAIAYLIWAYVEMGDYSSVPSLLESVPAELQEMPRIKAMIGLYHAEVGDEKTAREFYKQLLENPLPAGPFFVSALALGLGEIDDFLDLVERQIREKRWTQFWNRGHLFRNHEVLHDHPRYLSLLKRMGLDDEALAVLHEKMSFD
jgi:tetratricopeptide (TPR) repeat protein